MIRGTVSWRERLCSLDAKNQNTVAVGGYLSGFVESVASQAMPLHFCCGGGYDFSAVRAISKFPRLRENAKDVLGEVHT